MFCVNCGSNIDDDSTFCPECGKKIITSAGDANEESPEGTELIAKATDDAAQEVSESESTGKLTADTDEQTTIIPPVEADKTLKNEDTQTTIMDPVELGAAVDEADGQTTVMPNAVESADDQTESISKYPIVGERPDDGMTTIGTLVQSIQAEKQEGAAPGSPSVESISAANPTSGVQAPGVQAFGVQAPVVQESGAAVPFVAPVPSDAATSSQTVTQPSKKMKKGISGGKIAGIAAAVVAVLVVAGVLAIGLQPGAATGELPVNVTINSEPRSTDEGSTAEEQPADAQADNSATETTSSGGNTFVNGSSTTTEAHFVFPDSDSRYLTEAEITPLTDWELYIARNEIYARKGRGFKNSDLIEYFGSQPWYSQAYTADEFDSYDERAMLNDYEIKNAKLIRSIEQGRGSGYLNGSTVGPPAGFEWTDTSAAAADSAHAGVSGDGGESGSGETKSESTSGGTSTTSAGSSSDTLEAAKEALAKLDGWWQAGRQHDSISKMENGRFTTYTLDGEFMTEGMTFVPEGFIRMDEGIGHGTPDSTGTVYKGGPGWYICYEPGNTDGGGVFVPDEYNYTQMIPINFDGSGYSGGDTIGRVETPSWE